MATCFLCGREVRLVEHDAYREPFVDCAENCGWYELGSSIKTFIFDRDLLTQEDKDNLSAFVKANQREPGQDPVLITREIVEQVTGK